MTFLPIVERELRVACRRGGTYWTRWTAALAALIGGIWIYVLTFRDAPHQAGMVLFVTLTALANLYALLAGVRATADCLSVEKREGTLGLLFLTDLRGYDIVLGKLAATSLNAFYALLAMFPIMGISLLMGGVTAGEFGRVVLVCVNNLLFSLAMGMFCSSVSRDDRKAGFATFLGVLCITALPVLGVLVEEATGRNNLEPLFQLPSPGFTCFAAFDANYRGTRHQSAFWVSLTLVHGMTWLLLLLACWTMPRTWQDKISRSGKMSWATHLRQWQYGPPEARRSLRTRLLELNPVLWLASRERFKQDLVFLALVALAAVWIWGRVKIGNDWTVVAGIPFGLAAHTVLKVWLSNESCRLFSEDRRSGALELLLATPLNVKEVLRGQRWALWRQFAWPSLVVLAADGLLLSTTLSEMHPREGYWAAVWIAGMVMLVWDLYALSWVGPWMGLNSRSPSRASMAALTRICLLPWLLWLGGVAVLGMLDIFFRLRVPDRWQGWTFLLGWFVLSAAINLVFAGWAAHRLKTAFRDIATWRLEAAPRYGEWGRVLGRWLRKATER